MEELFFLATDKPCTENWCAENLAETRALRDAGKLVLAVDYADRPAQRARRARDRYAAERFAGCVTVRELDRIYLDARSLRVCPRLLASSGWAMSA